MLYLSRCPSLLWQQGGGEQHEFSVQQLPRNCRSKCKSRTTSASGLTVTARASKPKRTPSEWPLRGGSVFCEQYELSSQLPLAIFIICRWGEKSSCLDKSLCLGHNRPTEAASYGQLPRVAAPSVYFGPWAGLISCWPRPQQLLPVSAAGGGRRCCTC